MTTRPKTILVLGGGASNEREVSQRSSSNVAEALKAAGYHVTTADPAAPGFDLAHLSKSVDAVFPILHGAGGEDGVIQTNLEHLNLPYLGSDPAACKITFNKVRYKELLAENGHLTPNWEVVNQANFEASDLTSESYVLKPTHGGSSLDTFIVHNPRHQLIDAGAYAGAFDRYGKMLVEELIEGQEITVGVLDDTALPVILIIPPSGKEFDYENKYNGKSQEITDPPQLPPDIQAKAKQLAAEIHQLTGCRHFSRTDMIVTPSGSIYTLETNTIPGLTKQSLFPKAAAAAGYDLPKLMDHFARAVIS